MYCDKCGHELYEGNKYCTNCGALIENNPEEKKDKSGLAWNCLIFIVAVLIVVFGILLINKNKNIYYVSEIKEIASETTNYRSKTSVDASKYISNYVGTDTKYKDAIVKISESEKEKCSKTTTLKYEEELIKKYNLYSANLCELSDEYLENLISIYEYAREEYPHIFDYVYTNQLLYDANSKFAVSNGFSSSIALYGLFDSISDKNGSNNRLGMLLNTTYFLDEAYFEQIIIKNVNSGHFPENATIYSPIIHELGHKLHYDLVFMKYGVKDFSIVNDSNYNSVVKVYNDLNNQITTTEIVKKAIKRAYGIDTENIKGYTQKISSYAEVNANEAIGEAVHDWYLNGEKANRLSIAIVEILKEERAKYFG